MFDKTKRLEECIEYLNSVESRFNKEQYSKDLWLQEHCIVSDITPRQTGTTSSIAKLFDVKNDMYFTHNYKMVEHFSSALYELGKVESKYIKTNKIKYAYLPNFQTDNEKLLCMIADKLYIDLQKHNECAKISLLRGFSIDGISWFDIGQFGMLESSNFIYNYIKQLYTANRCSKFIIT